jgi:NarL family two-component system response regulator LiaR
METIRILIVDDHNVVRDGLCALISARPGLEVVGQASNGKEAYDMARILKPDVILMDLMMPVMDGIAAITAIRKDNPEARILVLTSFAEDQQVLRAMQAGAMGYLMKNTTSDELVRAIREVYRGEPAMQPDIARKLVLGMNRLQTEQPTVNDLTDRELEILKLVAQGMANQEISTRLVLSEQTVRTHVSNILSKLHLANRTQAALFAIREGLVK